MGWFRNNNQDQKDSGPGKTLVMIDGANFYATHQALGFTPDYKLLHQELTANYECARISFYTAEPQDTQAHNPHKATWDWMAHNGYNLVTKPMREYADDQGHKKLKGNMDVEMTVDCLTMVHRIERLVLFSGDGDFVYLVKQVKQIGVEVVVVSSCATKPPMCSTELRRTADEFIEVQELQQFIAFKKAA